MGEPWAAFLVVGTAVALLIGGAITRATLAKKGDEDNNDGVSD